MFSTKEPQPHVVEDSAELVHSAVGAVESPYVAATARLREKTLLIPNLAALKDTFYP